MDVPFNDKAGLLRSIAERADLREGPSGVEEVLRAIYRAGNDPSAEPLTARALARMVRMPVPVITALRRELEKEGVLQPGPHLELTPEVARAMIELWGWPPAPPAAGEGVICPECGGRGVAPRGLVWERLLGLLRKHFEDNPRVDVTLDQSHCTPETNLRRVALMHEQGAIAGKHVLVLGDDDSVSAAIALLGKVAGKDGRLAKRIVAVDTDDRILRHLRDVAVREGVIVGLVKHDLRQPLPEDLRGEFDTVSTDPPYTLPGLVLFLSRAVDALYPEGGRIYLHFGHRPPEEQVEVQQAIASMGLVIEQMVPNFNEYVGAGVLAGVSDLYVLSATPQSEPLVTGEFTEPLYTGELRPTLRTYACTECGTQYEVGGEAGGRFATIEALKEQGCPTCRNTSFKLISRRAAPHNGTEGEP